MEIKQLTNQEFDQFTKDFPLFSIYQTSSYAQVMKNQGFDTMLLGLVDQEKILAATLLLIKKQDGFKKAYAPRGFLIDYENSELLTIFTEKIKKFLEKLSIVSIRLAPLLVRNTFSSQKEILEVNQNYQNTMDTLQKLGYRHLGYNYNFEALKPRFDAILPLTPNYPLLFKNLKKELKTKIRSADKNGIKVYRGGILDLETFYKQIKTKYPRNLQYFQDSFQFFEKENMLELYYTKLNTAHFLKVTQKLFEKQQILCENLNNKVLNPNRVNHPSLLNKKIHADQLLEKYRKQLIYATKLLKEHSEGVVTSSCMIIKIHDQIFIYMDGYDPAYKRFNSKHLLLWKLIEKYSKLGYHTFHFGGMTDPSQTTEKYQGLNEFKLNFNCNIVEYAGDFELVTNNKLYFLYKNKGALKNILKG